MSWVLAIATRSVVFGLVVCWAASLLIRVCFFSLVCLSVRWSHFFYECFMLVNSGIIVSWTNKENKGRATRVLSRSPLHFPTKICDSRFSKRLVGNKIKAHLISFINTPLTYNTDAFHLSLDFNPIPSRPQSPNTANYPTHLNSTQIQITLLLFQPTQPYKTHIYRTSYLPNCNQPPPNSTPFHLTQLHQTQPTPLHSTNSTLSNQLNAPTPNSYILLPTTTSPTPSKRLPHLRPTDCPAWSWSLCRQRFLRTSFQPSTPRPLARP